MQTTNTNLNARKSKNLGADLGSSPTTEVIAKALHSHGCTAVIGRYQVRNFHNFYQSREDCVGKWKFHISGFDSSSSGQDGTCSIIVVGGSTETVKINAQDQLLILGRKYGRDQWDH